MRLKLALLLAFASSHVYVNAQSITIPAHSFSQTITINGKPTKVTITEPAQTVKIPAPVTALPKGLTFANGVLTVSGSIKASSINLTGGPSMPVSANGLYIFQLKGGYLQPVPYVPYTPPAITFVAP